MPAPIWGLVIGQAIGVVWWGVHQDAQILRLGDRVNSLEQNYNALDKKVDTIDANGTRHLGLVEERQRVNQDRLTQQQRMIDWIVQTLSLRPPASPP